MKKLSRPNHQLIQIPTTLSGRGFTNHRPPRFIAVSIISRRIIAIAVSGIGSKCKRPHALRGATSRGSQSLLTAGFGWSNGGWGGRRMGFGTRPHRAFHRRDEKERERERERREGERYVHSDTANDYIAAVH